MIPPTYTAKMLPFLFLTEDEPRKQVIGNYMTLGERFKLIKNTFNLKVEDLAYLLHVQKAYIYNVMRDERGISELTVQRLFETYGVSPEWLKNGSDRMFATWDKALPFMLEKDRFETVSEVLLTMEAISFVYFKGQENNVSTEYVTRLFGVCSYLMKKIGAGDREDIKDVLPTILGRSLDERYDKLQLLTGKEETTSGEAGLCVSNMIVSLLKKLKGMSQGQIQELSSMLVPWCFWLAKQAVSQTFVRVDTTVLGTVGCSDTAPAHVEKGTVVLDYEPSRDEDRRVVLRFPDAFCVTLTTSLTSLYELVYCLDNLVLRNIAEAKECNAGNWGITVGGDACTLVFRQNTAIWLTRDNFSDLTVLGVEIKKNKALYFQIVSEYLGRYGTI